jgi:hypothetical protein
MPIVLENEVSPFLKSLISYAAGYGKGDDQRAREQYQADVRRQERVGDALSSGLTKGLDIAEQRRRDQAETERRRNETILEDRLIAERQRQLEEQRQEHEIERSYVQRYGVATQEAERAKRPDESIWQFGERYLDDRKMRGLGYAPGNTPEIENELRRIDEQKSAILSTASDEGWGPDRVQVAIEDLNSRWHRLNNSGWIKDQRPPPISEDFGQDIFIPESLKDRAIAYRDADGKRHIQVASPEKAVDPSTKPPTYGDRVSAWKAAYDVAPKDKDGNADPDWVKRKAHEILGVESPPTPLEAVPQTTPSPLASAPEKTILPGFGGAVAPKSEELSPIDPEIGKAVGAIMAKHGPDPSKWPNEVKAVAKPLAEQAKQQLIERYKEPENLPDEMREGAALILAILKS